MGESPRMEPRLAIPPESADRMPPTRWFIILGLLTGMGQLSAQIPQDQADIFVQVYNMAQIGEATLVAALRQAGWIFSRTGIHVNWMECPLSNVASQNRGMCDGPAPMMLLRILPRAPDAFSGEAMGFGLPVPEGGIHAAVFYSRVARLSTSATAPVEQVLAHVIAHEIGHLLLGSNRHSIKGIMRGRWEYSDIRLAIARSLFFTPEEASCMRDEAIRRCIQHSRPEL
jgi:Zn-dependent protease with chaperone function